MNSSALIIFIRNPVLGKVKTRLAREIGEEQALKIYKHLLDHTRSITTMLPVDKFVFYEDFINQADAWKMPSYQKKMQSGDSLGMRMENAFADLFGMGYQQVMIIGSDCLELTSAHLLEAFDRLRQHEVVIGPALDGGYYLLGMTNLLPDIFRNKRWSTDQVFQDTLTDLQRLQIDYKLFPVLSDIDTKSDLPLELKSL